MALLIPTIFLRVLEYLDIPTFLNCRLINRTLFQVIAKHEASLTESLIDRVFPPHIKHFRHPKAALDDGIPRLLFLQQRHEVLIQTANVVISEAPISFFPRHAVDDPLADEYRADLQRGLAILWQLSDIAETVETAARQTEFKRKRFLGFLRPSETTVHRKLEDEVLSKRLAYIQSNLTAEDAFQFRLMNMAAFAKLNDGFTEIADHRSGVYTNKYAVGRGYCWLYWYILRHGPLILFDLWNPDITGYHQTVKAIEDEFSRKPKAFIKIERNTAREVHRELINLNSTSPSSYLSGLLIKNRDRERAAEIGNGNEVA
jgi:hypothetical protein